MRTDEPSASMGIALYELQGNGCRGTKSRMPSANVHRAFHRGCRSLSAGFASPRVLPIGPHETNLVRIRSVEACTPLGTAAPSGAARRDGKQFEDQQRDLLIGQSPAR